MNSEQAQGLSRPISSTGAHLAPLPCYISSLKRRGRAQPGSPSYTCTPPHRRLDRRALPPLARSTPASALLLRLSLGDGSFTPCTTLQLPSHRLSSQDDRLVFSTSQARVFSSSFLLRGQSREAVSRLRSCIRRSR